MPFPEDLKKRAKEKAHLRCCICKNLGAEIHHVIPEEEDGPDDPAFTVSWVVARVSKHALLLPT